MTREEINAYFYAQLAEKQVLITAHRGINGGNVIENTATSFLASVNAGADILEMDVPITLDKKLVVIHDGMERRLFRFDCRNTRHLTQKAATRRRYYNQCYGLISERTNTFDSVLEALKGKALINVDRCWKHWQPVFDAVVKHGMEQQILFKSAPKQEYLDVLKRQSTPFMYMAMCRNKQDVEAAKNAGVNLVAYELIFGDLQHPFADKEYLATLRAEGQVLFCSTINLEDKKYIAGGYDDLTALVKGGDYSWAPLMQLGYNIIQTDFAPVMYKYFAEVGLRTLTQRTKPI